MAPEELPVFDSKLWNVSEKNTDLPYNASPARYWIRVDVADMPQESHDSAQIIEVFFSRSFSEHVEMYALGGKKNKSFRIIPEHIPSAFTRDEGYRFSLKRRDTASLQSIYLSLRGDGFQSLDVRVYPVTDSLGARFGNASLILGTLAAVGMMSAFFFLFLRNRVYFDVTIFTLVLEFFTVIKIQSNWAMIGWIQDHPGLLEEIDKTIMILAMIYTYQITKTLRPTEMQSAVYSLANNSFLYVSFGALLLLPFLMPGYLVTPLISILAVFFAIVLIAHHHHSLRSFEFDHAAFVGLPFFVTCAFFNSLVVIESAAMAYADSVPSIAGSYVGAAALITMGFRLRYIERSRKELMQRLSADRPDARKKETQMFDVEVSIMFVDIVSFSKVSESVDPAAVFDLLARRLQGLTRIVENYGGTIDRSLGDGLLAFFTSTQHHHAVNAFNAAVAMQDMIIHEARAIGNQASEQPILPIRIGIHSDKVVIANIGRGSRIDYTMVGHGVNFANQLEQACTPFRIMLSNTTHNHLLSNGIESVHVSAIQIAVKHHSDLRPAFEVDPFSERLGDLNLAKKAYLSFFGSSERDLRVDVKSESAMVLRSSLGQFNIIDLSMAGFRTRSQVFIGQNALVELHLFTGQKGLDDELRRTFLDDLVVEVKWGRSTGGMFEHGFKIIGESDAQKRYRLSLLLAHPATAIIAA
ncbi:MAG: hypothetical protein FJ146_16440 [Deltaproteobacteria bacterium]|nr:hypothetical protein [Deltaproteobacteria bacterium]